MTNSFTVNTYSPQDVILTIGGYQLSGWNSISVNRSSKGFTIIKGIRGKNTRVSNKDTSATITISLLQSSPSNDVMSYIHELDLDAGTARIELTLRDLSGKSSFSSTEAYIVGYPVSSFTGEFSYRSWEIYCQSTSTYTIGGNTRPETGLFDSAVSGVADFVSGL